MGILDWDFMVISWGFLYYRDFMRILWWFHGDSGISWRFYGDFMGVYGDFMRFYGGFMGILYLYYYRDFMRILW